MFNQRLLYIGMIMGLIAPLSYADVQISITPGEDGQSQIMVNGQPTETPAMTPAEQQAADLQAIIDKSKSTDEALETGSSQRYSRKTEAQAQQDAEAARVAEYQLQQLKEAEATAAAREAGYNDVQRERVDREAAFQQQNADRQAQQQLNMQKYTDPAGYAAAMKAREDAAAAAMDQAQ